MRLEYLTAEKAPLNPVKEPRPERGNNDATDNSKPQKANYPFIDFVRFISMAGVVWLHLDVTPQQTDFVKYLVNHQHSYFIIFFHQLAKFGVICFFIISGFLSAERVQYGSRLEYFKRRVNNLMKPFMIAFAIWVLMTVIHHVHHGEAITFKLLLKIIYEVGFMTPLWFVPNTLICIAIILLFINRATSKYFGLALFLTTQFCAFLTVYTHTYRLDHSKVLIGYIFFFWLGMYIKRNNLLEKIYRLNGYLLAAITLALFFLTGIESIILYKSNLNYFSVLRFSNQLYSIAVFILLVNIGKNRKITFKSLNPRKETYGIFLYHGLFTTYVFPHLRDLIYAKTNLANHLNDWLIFTMVFLISYIFVYTATTITVKVLVKRKLAFL